MSLKAHFLSLLLVLNNRLSDQRFVRKSNLCARLNIILISVLHLNYYLGNATSLLHEMKPYTVPLHFERTILPED